MQKSHLNTHADLTSETRGLHFGLSLHGHPHFVCVISEGTGKSAHLIMLA